MIPSYFKIKILAKLNKFVHLGHKGLTSYSVSEVILSDRVPELGQCTSVASWCTASGWSS